MLRKLSWRRNSWHLVDLKNMIFSRKNNTGFLPSKEFFLKDMQPSLDLFITPESWLEFEMLGHSKEQVKWMLYPPEHWGVDPGYQEFKAFVKKIAFVNYAGENSHGSSGFSDADHQRNQAPEGACGEEQASEVSWKDEGSLQGS